MSGVLSSGFGASILAVGISRTTEYFLVALNNSTQVAESNAITFSPVSNRTTNLPQVVLNFTAGQTVTSLALRSSSVSGTTVWNDISTTYEFVENGSITVDFSIQTSTPSPIGMSLNAQNFLLASGLQGRQFTYSYTNSTGILPGNETFTASETVSFGNLNQPGVRTASINVSGLPRETNIPAGVNISRFQGVLSTGQLLYFITESRNFTNNGTLRLNSLSVSLTW